VPRSVERPIQIRFEHTLYPHWGGHSGYTQFIPRLDGARFRSTVHASSDSDADLPRWLGPFKPQLKRFVGRSGMSWYKTSDLHAEVIAIAAGMMGRFDVVHFLDGEHSGRFLPSFLKRAGKARVKTIATFHQPPEIAKDLLHVDSLRWLDRVVLVSPSQIPFFREHVPEDRLSVILHGVDTTFFHPAHHPALSERLRCITVGRWLRDWKTFAEVARTMPDVSFDVVGDPGGPAHELPNVRLYNRLDDKALAGLYHKADVVFLPLLQSTANNAMLEGMASGLAVVASDLEAVRAYIPREEAILCESASQFGRALRALQDDPSLLQTMKHKARTRAEALSWSRLIGAYEELYSKSVAA
jgi:glycosyltransferase involved in cell wall biosynthesis